MSSTTGEKVGFRTQSGQVYTELQHSSSHLPRVRLQFKAQHKDTKTGRAIPDICRTLDIRKTPDLRKILLLLDDRNGTYEVSKAREDKAGGPVLDAEEVTVSPSTSVKA